MYQRKPKRHDMKKERAVRRLFSEIEDNRINELVQIHGTKAWKIISRQMVNRTPRQCRERWKNYLSPEIRNGPWTEEEDILLHKMTQRFGTHWAQIAGYFSSRTDINVKNRWILLRRKSHRKSLHQNNIEEDTELISDKAQLTSTKVGKEVKNVSDNGTDVLTKDNDEFPQIIFWSDAQWGVQEDQLLKERLYL